MIGEFVIGILQRIMKVYRWLGFLSLVLMHGWLFVGAPIMNLLSIGDTLIFEIVQGYFSMLFWNDRGAELGSLLIWIGLTYQPIQWLLTGNKNTLPWSKVNNS